MTAAGWSLRGEGELHAILAPRSEFIIVRFGIAVVIETAAPGFSVQKSSKIPGSRRVERHDRRHKRLIFKPLLAAYPAAMRFFPGFFPHNREITCLAEQLIGAAVTS